VLGQEGPLDAAGEAGAAAAAQRRVLDRLDDLGGRHLVERLGQGAVAAVGAVGVERRAGLLEDATQEYGFKVGHRLLVPSYLGAALSSALRFSAAISFRK